MGAPGPPDIDGVSQEIIGFRIRGLGGPGGPGNHAKMWGAKAPTFWTGFWSPRGRPDPENRRFPGPKIMYRLPIGPIGALLALYWRPIGPIGRNAANDTLALALSAGLGPPRATDRPQVVGPKRAVSKGSLAILNSDFGLVFGRFSAKLGPTTPLERRGSSCSAGCTKNQPRRPILRPFRGNSEFWIHPLQ